MTESERLFMVNGLQHCYGCGKDWPPFLTYERACGECGHIWPEESDLIVDDVLVRQRLWRTGNLSLRPAARPPEQIDICPCCSHDL